MAGDILPTPIKELIEDGILFIGDGYRAKNSELAPSGLPFARVQNINNGFQLDEVDHFPVADLHRVGNKISEPGDVVFTSKGSVGRFAFVRDTTPRFVYSPQLCFWRVLDRRRINPQWLFYWMQSREFFIQFSGVAGQTDMADYVSLRDQRQMKIALPPFPEQRAIACILGALDDKIDLNRRMNRTLEAMARALFQSWFVDFDPVRAKAAGQAPTGLKPEIAALFPDRLVEVDGREVPEGWRVGSFLDLADLLSGGTPSTSVVEYWDGDIPWVSAKDVSGAKGSFLLETEKTISALGVEKSSTRILPAHTTIITARGTVGSYCILGAEMAMNQTNYGLRAKSGVGDFFVFFATAEMVDHLKQQAYGTIFDTITTNTFRDTKTVQPPKPILKEFDALSAPIMAKVFGNEQQSRTLSALRDTLLPKLISGALRVPDAERIVGKCM